MLQRIETTIEGIASAINKGITEKSKGEASVEKRKQELSAITHQIEGVKGRLLEIRRHITS